MIFIRLPVVDQIPDDNQLIAAIIGANDGDVTKYLSTGPDGYSKELIEQYIPFDPETEYCVVAFGCNGTAGTTAVTPKRGLPHLQMTVKRAMVRN